MPAKVTSTMVKIAEDRPALAAAVERIRGGGALPEAEQAVVAQQHLDAAGTLHASVEQMGAQLQPRPFSPPIWWTSRWLWRRIWGGAGCGSAVWPKVQE